MEHYSKYQNGGPEDVNKGIIMFWPTDINSLCNQSQNDENLDRTLALKTSGSLRCFLHNLEGYYHYDPVKDLLFLQNTFNVSDQFYGTLGSGKKLTSDEAQSNMDIHINPTIIIPKRIITPWIMAKASLILYACFNSWRYFRIKELIMDTSDDQVDVLNKRSGGHGTANIPLLQRRNNGCSQ